ncbi:MAG: PHP domain-containing protein [Desulfobacteraceae bacterium]|nr:MAG: PHP domain-containing protein [Desulfobacteraceae bacterium]
MNNINRILIEKPDLKELTKKYVVADLHFHSHYSDGKNSIDQITKAAEMLKIGIAITDHNAIQGAVEISRNPNLLSIPGIEITSKEGTHILVYFRKIMDLKTFYKNDILPHLGKEQMSSISIDLLEIIRRAKAYDSLTVFPHPFGSAYAGVCNSTLSAETQAYLLKKIDGIEVLNAGNLKKSNLRSAMLGFNLNKVVTGGSDGHSVSHMGKVVCYADCLNNRNAFFTALKNHENKVIGKEISMIRKVTSHSMKLKSSIKNYQNIIEKNIRYGRAVIHLKSKMLRENLSLKA